MMKRAIVKEDLYRLYSVTNPIISPQGDEAVFMRTHINEEKDHYHSHLFHINLRTGAVTQWTFGEEKITNPKWSPDGQSVAFLSNRNEKMQVFLLSKNGGEAKKITNFQKGVSTFLWSPCGKMIWLSATPDDKLLSEKSTEDSKKKLEPYVVDRMKYKADGVGLKAKDQYTHIWQLNIDTNEVTQFTEGNTQYSLEGISHDGKTIVLGVNRTENQDFDFSQPLFIVDTSTKKEKTLISENGYFGGAVFSFDDRYIAFKGSNLTYQNATHGHIYIYDTEHETCIMLTESLDLPVGDYTVADHQQFVSAPSVVWTKDNHLYFQVSAMGDVRLYFADLDGSLFPATQEYEHVYGYDITKDGHSALVAVSNPTFPGEIFLQEMTTGERKQLTYFNNELLEEVEFIQPEEVIYKGAQQWDVHGWLMKPVHFEEGKTYPLVVEIHGGPHAMYGNTFFHELQLLAAEGYGVLYVNPRGSHGYSQQFVDGVRNDYGGGDYEDIMTGLDVVLAEHDWIDEARLGVTGGSYGGFMTNWIVGHTNRFKAAVTQRSISNWISFYGVSDIGYYFTEWQIGADMLDVEKLWDHSPLKYAKNVETPLLILHSEKDFRCPIEQAEQLYITLKALGKETSFVRFPEADHNLSREGLPSLRMARLEQITGWFKRYL